MELADILAKDSVIVCKSKASKADLLRQLAARAAQGSGQDADAIFDALEAREILGSTGLGNRIAVPHCKLNGLTRVHAVFARALEPVEFDAIDDQPVDLVMMLMAPVGAGADHLKALARVARLLRTEALMDSIRATDDPDRIHALLSAPVAAHRAA